MSPSTQRPTGSPPTKELELDSTYLAAVRTLLAVLRTGSVVAGGGALVTNLLVTGWPKWTVITLSSAFVLLGYWMMWAALKKGRRLRTRFEGVGTELLFPHWQFAVLTVALQALILAVVVLYMVRR